MGSLPGWRKAYGALKDSTTVGLAQLNSDYKELDVAIVKATNHVDCPPKERHIRKIFAATSVLRPRTDVAYCIHALARRLHKTRNWTVAVKTLIVIHRILREGDPIFKEELLNFSKSGQIFQISNFKDDSSPIAWDCSAWVRTYALFLEERLECFRTLRYDIEADDFEKSSHSSSKVHSRTRSLNLDNLLEQLPALQKFLFRLIGCQPEGMAFDSYLIQYALALVLKESFKIYCAINDGVINLVDLFFEMSRHNALKALDIYKIAVQQTSGLSAFYEFCKGLQVARNFHFPVLRQPPSSFLATMEEYVREAPQIGSLSKTVEYHETNIQIFKEEVVSLVQDTPETPLKAEEKPLEVEEPHVTTKGRDTQLPNTETIEQPVPPTTVDLLCMDEVNPAAAELEESNALALAIAPPGGTQPSVSGGLYDSGTSGWELALVSAPSGTVVQRPETENKLAGGFDKLLLDSLYEDTSSRNQLDGGGYGGSASGNVLSLQDPFHTSSSIEPPRNVQMASIAQQQYQQYFDHHQQQNVPAYSYQPQYTQRPMGIGLSNPFGDPLAGVSSNVPLQPQGNLNLL